MQNKWAKHFIYITLFFSITSKGLAQVSLSGPTCIIPGTVYQYNIAGSGADSSNMQICITGGVFADTASACRNGGAFNYIRVIWQDSASGSISFTALEGNASVNVTMTQNLSPGSIDSSSKFQSVSADSVPQAINCPAATGGNCSPSYQYQWQQSADGFSWSDVSGAAAQQLQLPAAPAQTMYYRRRVTEVASNSQGFSDAALIILLPKTTMQQ